MLRERQMHEAHGSRLGGPSGPTYRERIFEENKTKQQKDGMGGRSRELLGVWKDVLMVASRKREQKS